MVEKLTNDRAAFNPGDLDKLPPALPPQQELVPDAASAVWASMPLTEVRDRELVYLACNSDAKPLIEQGEQPFHVRLIVAHWAADRETEDGETFTLRRAVFIAPDGARIESFSDEVFKCISQLLATFGQGPWVPALILKLRKVKGRKPQPAHKLEYLGRVPGEANGKGTNDAKKPKA